jgi:hypothetical protein
MLDHDYNWQNLALDDSGTSLRDAIGIWYDNLPSPKPKQIRDTTAAFDVWGPKEEATCT